MKTKFRTALIIGLIVLIPAILAFAAGRYYAAAGSSNVPRIIPYDGTLERDGIPVKDGSYNMKFEFYDAESAGSRKWDEASTVDTKNGKFLVNLGSTKPIDDTVFDSPELWLQMTVDGNVLAPRQKINSVPFAVKAAIATNTEISKVVNNPYCSTPECAGSEFQSKENKQTIAANTTSTLYLWCPTDYPIPVSGGCNGAYSGSCTYVVTSMPRNWENPSNWKSAINTERAGWACVMKNPSSSSCDTASVLVCRKESY
jgi:hypothetical protein